jgi:3-oxoacyl-[acyl-carrier protein] reductase
MSDLLLENQNARKLIKTLGLPIPVPEKLARAKGPYEERPLDDKKVLVCGAGGLQTTLAQILTKAGANPWVVGDTDAVLEPFIGPGEAWARTPHWVRTGDAPEGERIDAIVFDGTGLESPDDLRQVYDFMHPWIRRLNRSGRVVVIGRPAADAKKPARAAAREQCLRRRRRGEPTRPRAALPLIAPIGVHQLPAVSCHQARKR